MSALSCHIPCPAHPLQTEARSERHSFEIVVDFAHRERLGLLRYAQARYRVRTHEAEDILQDALLRLWKGFPDAVVPIETSAQALVRWALHNCFIDQYRLAKRRPEGLLTANREGETREQFFDASGAMNPEERVLRAETEEAAGNLLREATRGSKPSENRLVAALVTVAADLGYGPSCTETVLFLAAFFRNSTSSDGYPPHHRIKSAACFRLNLSPEAFDTRVSRFRSKWGELVARIFSDVL